MFATENGFSVIHAFLNFAQLGAQWVLWLLVGLGFLLLVIVLERLRLYARTRIDAPVLGRRLLPLLTDGRIDDARALVARGVAMEERVLADALEVWSRGPVAVDQIHGQRVGAGAAALRPVGLMVAIPAVVAFNTFKGVGRTRVSNTDFLCRQLLAELNRTAATTATAAAQKAL